MIVLASGSPRRRDLLGKLVADFRVLTSPIEETADNRTPPEAFASLSLPAPFSISPTDDPRLWAWRKAVDVEERNRREIAQGALILAADTVVSAPERLLGKPATVAEAGEMLRLLRGRSHLVITGFVLLRATGRGAELLSVEVTVSPVTMRSFTEEELATYLLTGESLDKAGAYALQGLGGKLVERVEGCRTNVVGLPLCRVRAALEASQATLAACPPEGYCLFCPRMRLAR